MTKTHEIYSPSRGTFTTPVHQACGTLQIRSTQTASGRQISEDVTQMIKVNMRSCLERGAQNKKGGHFSQHFRVLSDNQNRNRSVNGRVIIIFGYLPKLMHRITVTVISVHWRTFSTYGPARGVPQVLDAHRTNARSVRSRARSSSIFTGYFRILPGHFWPQDPRQNRF